ncbi:hypothetical protein OIO90_001298 [Microbotryomycetes sp. JL221]|nr:hypothetical protein OIO90_001298 [Microbotryomycetes sp. JL221]
MAFKRSNSVEEEAADDRDSNWSPIAEEDEPAAKKLKSTTTPRRLTAAEREQRKEERMERNRRAAQASRDRKKAQQDHLETRIAELEQQLADALANQQTTTLAAGPVPVPVPAHAPSSSRDVSPSNDTDERVIRLERENTQLRQQLQTEKLESDALKARLGSLELKFARLEDLLKGDTTTATPTSSRPVLPSPAPSLAFSLDSTLDLAPVADTLFAPLPHAQPNLPPALSPRRTRGRSFPAAEAVNSTLSTANVNNECNVSPFGIHDTTDIASGFGLDSGTTVVFDELAVQNAWNNWAQQLQPIESQPLPHESTSTDGGAFDWLSNDVVTHSNARTNVERSFASGDVFSFLHGTTLASAC